MSKRSRLGCRMEVPGGCGVLVVLKDVGLINRRRGIRRGILGLRSYPCTSLKSSHIY